ncbi:MAG TPA: MarR family transcriptional regulator [Acidimicrobiia bacterium]|jgi:DNA-binding MarR family transcriptional regulator
MADRDAAVSPAAPQRPLLPASLMAHTGFLLHQTAEEIGQLVTDRLAPLELKGPQYGFLALLEESGGLSQHDAATRLHVDRTTTMAMVDELERQGRVERRRDPNDRRKNALYLTGRGRSTIARAHRIVAAAEVEYFEPLSGAQREALHRMLTTLDERAQWLEQSGRGER